jgi:hypothetical protein
MIVDELERIWKEMIVAKSRKSKPRKKPAGSERSLLFDPEDVGDIFLRNVGLFPS